LFPPVGSIWFSVGATGGADDVGGAGGVVVADVVVGVVLGSSVLSLPQAAVSAPIAMMPVTPATAAKLRANGRDLMTGSLLMRSD
jgi:hypothetical protein